MADILDWQEVAHPHQLVGQAAQALRMGRLVAFPTETVYGLAASALVPEAVERLVQSKGREENKPLALAIGGAGEVRDWLPGLGSVGQRLARRCWPGPLTLVSEEGVADGLVSRLPDPVRRWVCPQGTLGLRAPAHEAILQVLRQMPGPVVLTSANRAGEPEAATAEEVTRTMGGYLDLIVADGPCRYGKASTVVGVSGNTWKVLREGVVSTPMLQKLAGCMVVFICTGNTCRSPLAEALCKKLLAERQGCQADELAERGFLICSAGLAAHAGGPAALEALEVARELGADLSGHESQPLTAQLAAQADYLVVMTRGHLFALADQFPRLGTRPRLLSPDGADVPDPLGADRETYQSCARQILSYLEQLMPEMVQS